MEHSFTALNSNSLAHCYFCVSLHLQFRVLKFQDAVPRAQLGTLPCCQAEIFQILGSGRICATGAPRTPTASERRPKEWWQHNLSGWFAFKIQKVVLQCIIVYLTYCRCVFFENCVTKCAIQPLVQGYYMILPPSERCQRRMSEHHRSYSRDKARTASSCV